MSEKRTNITSAQGFIGGIEFSLTGSPDMVEAIVKYIRNLTRYAYNNH